MLKELSQYENLGTPRFFYELFTQLRNTQQQWTTDSIRAYFYNRIVDGRGVFDGCLPLIEAVKAISINDKGLIVINPLLESSLLNERYFTNRLFEMILSSMKDDDIFHEIFCSKNISYDIIYRLIQIDGSAFRFRYVNFRRLFIDFKFLYPHPDKNIRKFIVSSGFKKLFDRQIMPEIKKRKIGVGELEKSLEQKLIYGAEAEAFALKYERGRLISHRSVGKIEIVSGYNIAAGYDIVSYNDYSSVELDIFIEVKSFVGVPNFYWSRNEIAVARLKKEQYFLYLVDRDKISDPKYVPTRIQNPHDRVLGNDTDWSKRIESYFIISK